jgi:hypothetical protein
VADGRGCNWAFGDMLWPWADNYTYYASVRLQLLLTVITLTFFRCGKRTRFLSFPYVCPEPVLVK